jgi:hypothetical protein
MYTWVVGVLALVLYVGLIMTMNLTRRDWDEFPRWGFSTSAFPLGWLLTDLIRGKINSMATPIIATFWFIIALFLWTIVFEIPRKPRY